MPWEYLRWTFITETGWTLEQMDALSLGDLHEWMQVRDGRNKAMKPPDRPRVRKR
jgi:hypothetical protein